MSFLGLNILSLNKVLFYLPGKADQLILYSNDLSYHDIKRAYYFTLFQKDTFLFHMPLEQLASSHHHHFEALL